jgi:hypothetical protein
MKQILLVAAVAAAALAAAACDNARTDANSANSAYINSGASATAAMPPSSYPSQPATVASNDTLGPPPAPERQASTDTATSDTASPNTANPVK